MGVVIVIDEGGCVIGRSHNDELCGKETFVNDSDDGTKKTNHDKEGGKTEVEGGVDAWTEYDLEEEGEVDDYAEKR